MIWGFPHFRKPPYNIYTSCLVGHILQCFAAYVLLIVPWFQELSMAPVVPTDLLGDKAAEQSSMATGILYDPVDPQQR